VDIVDKTKISVIPQSTEKVMTFSIGNLRFLDTTQLMPSSLDFLVNNLKTKNEDNFEKFKNMKQHFNEEDLELIHRRYRKVKETQLPPIQVAAVLMCEHVCRWV
jgi:hypothetical protein